MERSYSVKIDDAVSFIKSYQPGTPAIGIILGSGLGYFADLLNEPIKIPTGNIPHFPVSTVIGHAGFLVFGHLDNIPLLALQGRTHFYEGHPIADVAFVVRIMTRLGIKLLIVTNAAGGVNRRFSPGDLMIITDHINFMFRNPLTGPVLPGENRWTDMHNAYDPEYSALIEQVGLEQGIPLQKGVLFVSTGPTYESAAEVRMAKKLGADAVSMSTVPEVITARANKVKVVGISCITNLATGISATRLDHEEVTRIAGQTRDKFQKLLTALIRKIGPERPNRDNQLIL